MTLTGLAHRRYRLAPSSPAADLFLSRRAPYAPDPGGPGGLPTQGAQDAGLNTRPHRGPRFEQIRMEGGPYPHGPVAHRRALILPGLRAARPTESGKPVRLL